LVAGWLLDELKTIVVVTLDGIADANAERNALFMAPALVKALVNLVAACERSLPECRASQMQRTAKAKLRSIAPGKK
jgi:hypothetical protein